MDAIVIGRVLVVGGTGRLGRLLRAAWAAEGQPGLVWQRRVGAGGVSGPGPCFDPLSEPDAFARAARGADAIVNLAGRVAPEGPALDLHTDLALAAVTAGGSAGVGHVFLASSAAVYGAAHHAGEESPLYPVSAYGRAKQEMEKAVLASATPGRAPAVTCLRIGNVAGADQLLGAPRTAMPQPLHVLADGQGPTRSYIGPRALAATLAALFAARRAGHELPRVLNVALPGGVRMDALLDADGRAWRAVPAPKGVLPEVTLDTGQLEAVAGPLPEARADRIVADLASLREFHA